MVPNEMNGKKYKTNLGLTKQLQTWVLVQIQTFFYTAPALSSSRHVASLHFQRCIEGQ